MNSQDSIFSIDVPSPIGTMTVLFDKSGVLRVSLRGRGPKQSPELTREIATPRKAGFAMTKVIKKEFAEYFSGKRKNFTLKFSIDRLDLTDFQKRTLKALLTVPYGSTISYKELAKRAGAPKACRAVGNANGKNPLPIIIPCHRVVAADGGIGGFSCGLDIKRKLLKFEMSKKGGNI